MEFREKITALRKKNGMTQAQLGAELNVTFQAVSKWERGESLPDFVTMSKMAKLFGVTLNYFEDDVEYESDGEVAEDEQSATADDGATAKMVGVCTVCGKVLYDGDAARTSPAVICNECVARRRGQLIAKREEEKRQKEEAIKKSRAAAAQVSRNIRQQRNRGIIGGSVAAGLVLILLIVALAVSSDGDKWMAALGGIIIMVFAFAYVAQLIWGGVVRNLTLTGGKIIPTPGVIFTLDLQGCLFLIGAKVFFALLSGFIYVITLLFFGAVGLIISPFTFFPRLLRLTRGDIAAD